MSDAESRVVVVDVKIPFWSMVVLLVKWALAAIPAIVILYAIGAGLGFVFSELLHWHLTGQV